MKNLSLKQAFPMLVNPIYAACRSTWAEVRPGFAHFAPIQGITQQCEENRAADPLEVMMRMFFTGRIRSDPPALKQHERLFHWLSTQPNDEQEQTARVCEFCNNPEAPVFYTTDPTTGLFEQMCPDGHVF